MRTTIERGRPNQIVLVTASGTRAHVIGCERVADKDEYVRVLGPFAARVGREGVAPRGAKREGDFRTPSGVFALGSGFGVKDPGLAGSFGWFNADAADVWVDDSSSTLYNTHQVDPARGRWTRAEKLRIKPYRIAQVIGYNRARVPGRGSAIFLHVGTGRSTAGCVSLRAAHLRAVLRWERIGAVIAIAKSPPKPRFGWTARKVSAKKLGKSWHRGCPVPPSDLRAVSVRFWGFDRKPHTGVLILHRDGVRRTRSVFATMFDRKFKLRSIRPVSAFGASDDASMAADNTSAFNCRRAVAAGPPSWSRHAYGRAIDVNPVENPYLFGNRVLPPAGKKFIDRSAARRGLIRRGSAVHKAFLKAGYRWGGDFSNPDYQHFDR